MPRSTIGGTLVTCASRSDHEGLTSALSSSLVLRESGQRLPQDVVLVGTIVTPLQMLVYSLQGGAERRAGQLHLNKGGEVSHTCITRHLLVTRVHHLRDEGLGLFWTQGYGSCPLLQG